MGDEDQNSPITRREGDRIWKTIDDLKLTISDNYKDIRRDFGIVFEKLDEVKEEYQKGLSRCIAHTSKMDELERRIDKFNGSFSLIGRVLSDVHKIAVTAAIIVGGIWALIKFGS